MEITKNGRVFGLYSTIKEIPAGRLMAFQVELTQHHAMGSTFEELDAATERLQTFLQAQRTTDALNEFYNLRMGFWLMFHNINSQLTVLAYLVKSVDGIEVQVRTDDEAKKIADLLGQTDLSTQEAEDIIEQLKKKFNAELRRYIPTMFKDNDQIAVAADVVNQALLRIAVARGESDKSKELSEIDNRILDTIKPLCFDDSSSNYQVEVERSFESLCALLASKGIVRPHEISTLQFYLNIQLLTEKKPKGRTADEWQQEI